MNDPRVVRAATQTVSLIVRRPHAYSLLKRFPKVPIPGLLVLNAKGELLGAVKMPSRTSVDDLVEIIDGHRK